MDWMILPLKRYADFAGRSRRKEYWMFTLGLLILYVLVIGLFFAMTGSVPDDDIGRADGPGTMFWVLVSVLGLGLFVPSLAVQVRRFHDQDKSGWFILLSFVPFVGGLIMLFFMVQPGTPGENRFGPDPLEADWVGTTH